MSDKLSIRENGSIWRLVSRCIDAYDRRTEAITDASTNVGKWVGALASAITGDPEAQAKIDALTASLKGSSDALKDAIDNAPK